MTTYNTGNPIGSTAPQDLYDNAENFDQAANNRSARTWVDRFGKERKTLWGMEQDFQDFLLASGYQDIGDYGAGLEITAYNQVFRYNGELYRAGPGLELPYTTTGDWGAEGGNFVAVGDGALRQDLAKDGSGSSLVAYKNGSSVSRELDSVRIKTSDSALSASLEQPEVAPEFIQTAGQSNAGDGKGGMYKNNGTDSGDLVVTLSDGVTKAGYDFVADVHKERLTSGVKHKVETPFFRNLHRKRIFCQLPAKFPDYDWIISGYGYASLYPQGFAIDEDDSEIFIIYETTGGDGANWFTVWDKDTLVYKSCFRAGYSICEKVEIKHEGTQRYLYSKVDTGGDIAKYDITVLPGNRAEVFPESSFPVGLAAKWSFLPNGWSMVGVYGSPIGSYGRYYQYELLNSSFARKGVISFDIGETGYRLLDEQNSFSNHIPKWQGIATGDGFIVAGVGGSYNITQDIIPYRYAGVKAYDMSGKKILEAVYSPDRFLSVLNDAGINTYRLENEGVWVSKDQRVYSLWVTGWGSDPGINSSVEGITILEEFADGADDAIDFGPAAIVGFSIPDKNFGVKRSKNQLVNYITGEQITTLSGVLDYMINTDKRELWLYTSSTPLVDDINGGNMPSGTKLTFWNLDNRQFFVENLSVGEWRYYYANKTGGAWTYERMNITPATSA